MGTESKSWLIWWAVAASAAVHAGAAAGVAAFPTSLPFGETTPASEIDFVVVDLPEETPPLPPPEPPPSIEDLADRPRLATVIRDVAPDPSRLQPTIEPEALDEPEPRREEEDEDEERRRPLVSLDPASVAAASVVFEDEAPRAPRRAGRSDQSREQALEDALGGALAEAANARPHVSRRPPPRLRSRRDGSYVFHGHVFDAVIRPDGSVAFADRGSVEMDTPSVTRPNGLLPSGSFDVSDAIESARGQDPHRHERRWFMEQTRELRERLADQVDARDRRRGMGRLRGQLRRIWASRGSAERRRAAIFRLWDDCAEDEVGRRARASIVAFVRETLPRGSEEGYTRGELSSLNRERLSSEAFSPY